MKTNTTVEAFKTDFNINTDTTDVNFKELNVERYDSLPQNHQFGEKVCLLYRIKLMLFNIEISLRVLAFKYNDHAEVLKLEITIQNELLSKEVAPCKNFLQRKRNVNLAFEVLAQFTRLFEMRRLICVTVFEKQANVVVLSDDGGVIVKCCNDDFSVKYLELNWTITWKIEHYEVADFIEFYLNYRVLEGKVVNQVKKRLEILIQPNVDFHLKLKLWKSVMCDIYGYPVVQSSRSTASRSADVLEISDSDSDDSVIEVDQSVPQSPGGDEVMVID